MIDHIIPTSNLELIRAQIYSVLSDEFDNQVYEFGNTACSGVSFFAERFIPLDKTESPSVVIKTYKGDFGNKSVGSTHAMPYSFIIDVMVNAKSTPAQMAYLSGTERLLKLTSMIRYILESPSYLTLGFDPGFIERTEVKGFSVYENDREKDGGASGAQIMFDVYCEETSAANTGIPLGGSDTTVYLYLTDRGYQYGESFTPPLDPRYVYIVDQNGNVLDEIEGGNTYEVTVIQRIIDTITGNTTTITDNIVP